MKKTILVVLMIPLMLSSLFALGLPPNANELVGVGEWQSLGGESIHGTWKVSLQRSATRIDGTMELSGSTVLRGGSVSGSIDGKSVVLGISSDGITTATFTGQLTGESISGEWSCPAVKDEGVWRGTLSQPK